MHPVRVEARRDARERDGRLASRRDTAAAPSRRSSQLGRLRVGFLARRASQAWSAPARSRRAAARRRGAAGCTRPRRALRSARTRRPRAPRSRPCAAARPAGCRQLRVPLERVVEHRQHVVVEPRVERSTREDRRRPRWPWRPARAPHVKIELRASSRGAASRPRAPATRRPGSSTTRRRPPSRSPCRLRHARMCPSARSGRGPRDVLERRAPRAAPRGLTMPAASSAVSEGPSCHDSVDRASELDAPSVDRLGHAPRGGPSARAGGLAASPASARARTSPSALSALEAATDGAVRGRPARRLCLRATPHGHEEAAHE